MKKNGFTLIELLAVIVILAIIAIIAVPIVINIINDTKESSEEENLKLYEDAVQKMIVKKQMQDPSFNPSECKIKDDGNLECTVGTNKVIVEVEVKGRKPNKGTVTIEVNKISLKNVELNGKKYYERGMLVDDVDENEEISRGDKYTYKVNDKDTFTFYVLSVEGDKVNLIMDRNICGANDENNGKPTAIGRTCNITWSLGGGNSNGPVKAMQGIYNATKNWTNVPDMNLDYEDEGHIANSSKGYGKIETTATGIKITKKDGTTEVTRSNNQTPVIPYEEGKSLKARLPKHEEVYNTGTDDNHCHNGSGTCPVWLVENLAYFKSTKTGVNDKYSMNNKSEVNQNIRGYWVLSAFPNSSDARYVSYIGDASMFNNSSASDTGLRAVITVPKSDLS